MIFVYFADMKLNILCVNAACLSILVFIGSRLLCVPPRLPYITYSILILERDSLSINRALLFTTYCL